MKRLFAFTIYTLIASSFLWAQDATLNHTVKKGETVYSISRKYNVAVGDVLKLNPDAGDIIYPNEILKIPNSKTSNSSVNQGNSSKSTITHKVKRGETKFGLSRTYGVSIASLEAQNPQIRTMLQAGHILKINKNSATTSKSKNGNKHTVVKGETLWGISNKYNVKLNRLIAANADQLSEFLQIGQTLRIPEKSEILQPVSNGKYLVKRGDTKFSLAQQFNMSITQLERLNPQTVPMLMAGQQLAISDDTGNSQIANIQEVKTDKSKSESNETSATRDKIIYVDYIILPRETLYGLSKRAGLTVDEMTTLNPILLKRVKAGDLIKMPLEVRTTSPKIEKPEIETKAYAGTSERKLNEALISNLSTVEKNGLYFYLPFNEREFKSLNTRDVSSTFSDQKSLDFYRGAQMAIDSSEALNLNLKVSVIKTRPNAKLKIEIDDVNNENAVIIPFLENSAEALDIDTYKNVSVVDVQSNVVAMPNTTIYGAIPSEEIQKIKTLDYLAGLDNANVIAISETGENRNKTLISKMIPDAKFLEVDDAGVFGNNQLKSALELNQINYIILDSDETIIFLNVSTTLMRQMSDYNIQLALINSKLLPKQNEVSIMRYKILKIIYPSIPMRSDTLQLDQFKQKYVETYNAEVSADAISGFDITMDVILRLSQNSPFKGTVLSVPKSEQLQLIFDYEKITESYYSNSNVHLMQFDSKDGIKQLE